MRRIHQLFKEPDQETIRRATIESGREALCWYPSAGVDFRHVRMMEEEGLNDPAANPPLIYLHTDMMLPMNWDDSSNPRLLAPNDQVGASMRIGSVIEVHPKRIMKDVSKDVWNFDGDEYTGKVFLLEVEMETIHRGRMIRLPVPVLYFIVENLCFLVHFLLHYQLRVDTLVHIKDGGASMGGSRIPMNFIYQANSILKMKRVICDKSPEAKRFNTHTEFHVLMHELMRCEGRAGRGHSRRIDEHIREISEHDIRSAWEGTRIDHRRMPANRYRPPDGFYYDWRPRIDPQTEQL